MADKLTNDELMLHLKRFILQQYGWNGLNAWNRYINDMVAIEGRATSPDVLFIDSQDGDGAIIVTPTPPEGGAS